MADINDIISGNLGLVYAQLARFNKLHDPDAESFAYEALYKAIATYDASTGGALSTYATCIIANALRTYIRSTTKKRQLAVISYDEPCLKDESTTLLDTLCTEYTLEDALLDKEYRTSIVACLEKVYNALTIDNHKLIFSLWVDSDFTLSQTAIAKQVHVSQPYVSNVLSTIKYKIRLELEEHL